MSEEQHGQRMAKVCQRKRAGWSALFGYTTTLQLNFFSTKYHIFHLSFHGVAKNVSPFCGQGAKWALNSIASWEGMCLQEQPAIVIIHTAWKCQKKARCNVRSQQWFLQLARLHTKGSDLLPLQPWWSTSTEITETIPTCMHTCCIRGILLRCAKRHRLVELERRSKPADLWVGRFCLEEKQWKECWGICSVRCFARKRVDGSQTHENGCALAGAEQAMILARRIDSGPVGRMNGLPETGWLLLLVLIWRNAFWHWTVLPRLIHPLPNETTVYWFQ